MIELINLSKTYRIDSVRVEALKNINLKIEKGEFVAIMGPSGSGKSTLLNIIGCLDTPTSGRYLLDSVDVSKMNDNELAEIRNRKIGFVFQSFNLLPKLNAIDNVELPLIYSGNAKMRKKKAVSALESVGLGERLYHKPSELSGGQQQKVAIARALVNDPLIILADEPTGNLDSASGAEIMKILSRLNEKGITIVIVTHEDEIATYAKRVIRLRDGIIVEDRRKDTNPLVANQGLEQKKFRRPFFSLSEIYQSFKMAIYSIMANKLRSFLTMLGIIVGVAAVIIMIALGKGAEYTVTSNISRMGTNLLMIFPGGDLRGPMRASSITDVKRLTFDDAKAILENCPSVSRVDAVISRNGTVIYGSKNKNTTIIGSTKNFPFVRNFPVERGNFFADEDDHFMRRVCVIGKTVYKNLFGDEDPIGKFVKINRQMFQVIGVMSEKGSTGFRDEDDVVFVPLRTAQKRLFGVDFVGTINVEVRTNELMDRAAQEITALLRQRHRIPPHEESDFTIRSQKDILTTMQSTTRTFTLLLAGIAIVSLIVGGIGIMNIMFVSVTERTREIGIRKAIGGKKRDILSQFLIESIIVSLTGCTIGILVGVLLSQFVSDMLFKWKAVITPNAIMLSFGFAFGVGLFFGFYPAYKAANLNPIEALRYE